jgi:hypothetical protein
MKELTMFIEEKIYMFDDRNIQDVTSPSFPLWSTLHMDWGLHPLARKEKGVSTLFQMVQVPL